MLELYKDQFSRIYGTRENVWKNENTKPKWKKKKNE